MSTLSLTDEQLTAATLAAGSSIRARLTAIGHPTPGWFAEEAAAVLAAEIRKVSRLANPFTVVTPVLAAEIRKVSRLANPFTVVTPSPGTPSLTTNAA